MIWYISALVAALSLAGLFAWLAFRFHGKLARAEAMLEEMHQKLNYVEFVKDVHRDAPVPASKSDAIDRL